MALHGCGFMLTRRLQLLAHAEQYETESIHEEEDELATGLRVVEVVDMTFFVVLIDEHRLHDLGQAWENKMELIYVDVLVQ